MKIELTDLIEKSSNIVFFGGAGVSVESGIPDFRSTDGLYHQKYSDPPEEILSHHYFLEKTAEFYRFYRKKMIYLNAKPNRAHLALAYLERIGKLKAVITQNIDGLHQAAGSKTVFELHGSVQRNTCLSCGKKYSIDAIVNGETIPRCTCGGVIKPDVVLYEEPLDEEVVVGAIRAIEQADLLIVGGTSLTVYPAAGLLQYFDGEHIVLINKTATDFDTRADLVFHDSIGSVLWNAVNDLYHFA